MLKVSSVCALTLKRKIVSPLTVHWIKSLISGLQKQLSARTPDYFFYFCKNTPSDVVNQLRQETKMFIFSLASLTMKHESDFLWEAMLNLINLT